MTSRLCIKMRVGQGEGDTRTYVHGVGTRGREMRDFTDAINLLQKSEVNANQSLSS